MPKETSTENNPKGLGNVDIPFIGKTPSAFIAVAVVVAIIVAIAYLTPKTN